MSKKIFLLNLLLLFTFTVVGCQSNNYLDNSFAVVYQDDVPYLINEELKTYSLKHYDEILPFFDEYLIVSKVKNDKHLFGYIKNNGQEIIKPTFQMAYPFSEEKAVVVKNNTTQIIDINNKTLHTFASNITSSSKYSCGYLLVKVDDYYSFLDHQYQLHGAFAYAREFVNGYAVVGNYQDDTLVYNYFDGTDLLFDDDTLKGVDFVDNFYDGYARIAQTVTYDGLSYLKAFAAAATTEQKNDTVLLTMNGWPYTSYANDPHNFFVFSYSTVDGVTNLSTLLTYSFLRKIICNSTVFDNPQITDLTFRTDAYNIYCTNKQTGEEKLILTSDEILGIIAQDVNKVSLNSFNYISLNYNNSYKTYETNVLPALTQYVYSYINIKGELLKTPNGNTQFNVASNFSEGHANTIVYIPETFSFNLYYLYNVINTTGATAFSTSRFRSIAGSDLSYIFGKQVLGSIPIKKNESGSGSWTIARVENDSLEELSITMPEKLKSYQSTSVAYPYLMSELKYSRFFDESNQTALAHVYVYTSQGTSLFGIVNHLGVYVLPPIYTNLFY